MFCPKCSQQQISEEMRFCSRCGFPLHGVREVMITGGLSPSERLQVRSRAMKGARQGTWLMLAGLPLTFFVGLLTAIDDDFAFLLIFPALCLIMGFLRLLYGVFIQDRAERKTQGTLSGASATLPAYAGRNMELLPSRIEPVNNFTGTKRTAEVVHPPSVTENTTKLLDE
jgi:hypothetical protein